MDAESGTTELTGGAPSTPARAVGYFVSTAPGPICNGLVPSASTGTGTPSPQRALCRVGTGRPPITPYVPAEIAAVGLVTRLRAGF